MIDVIQTAPGLTSPSHGYFAVGLTSLMGRQSNRLCGQEGPSRWVRPALREPEMQYAVQCVFAAIAAVGNSLCNRRCPGTLNR